jgi:peptidoglycan/LPS O-acetylase OafA/YrhL
MVRTDASSQPGHIPSLDGIRAISFLMVFASHGELGHIIPGGFGVTVFFFLSGFLITTLMRIEADRTGMVDVQKFYIRRILRILPPFYLFLVVAIVLNSVNLLGGSFHLAAVLAQICHVSNYYLITNHHLIEDVTPSLFIAGTVVLWSLAVEEHFYLIYPFFYRWLRVLNSQRRQGAVLLFLCLSVLLWRVFLIYVQGAESTRTAAGTDTRIDSILFGCLLAVAGNPVLDAAPQWTRHLRVLGPLALAMLLFTFLYRDQRFRDTFRYTMQGLALLPCFTVAIRSRGVLFALLNWTPLRYLGVISYSLYLIHDCALDAVARLLGGHGFLASSLALICSIAFAIVTRYAIEIPSQKLRGRLLSRLQRRRLVQQPTPPLSRKQSSASPIPANAETSLER